MTDKTCHKMTRQARAAITPLDSVELFIVREKIERAARFASRSQKNRLIEINLNGKLLVVVWRYTGETTDKGNRKIIQWESAFLRQQTEHINKSFIKQLAHGFALKVTISAALAVAGGIYATREEILQILKIILQNSAIG